MAKLILKSIYLLILVSFLLVNDSWCSDAKLCEGKQATLDCLMDHSYELYETNIDLFWKILNTAAKRAEECKTISDVTRFMKIVNVPRDGAFEEYFHEKVEKLLVKNDKCFFDALTSMPGNNQVQIVGLLLNPLFVEQPEITKVFNKNKKNKKYKNVVNMYLKQIDK